MAADPNVRNGSKAAIGIQPAIGHRRWVNKIALAAGLLCVAVIGGCQQETATYKTGCSARLPEWGGPSDGIGHLRGVLSVSIDASGATHWGEIHTSGPVRSTSTIVSDTTLQRYMTKVSKLNPEPQLVLEVAAQAPCSRVRAVRQIIGSAPLCKASRLCSEGANWEEWPFAGGP
jgi:hypothetical protein